MAFVAGVALANRVLRCSVFAHSNGLAECCPTIELGLRASNVGATKVGAFNVGIAFILTWKLWGCAPLDYIKHRVFILA